MIQIDMPMPENCDECRFNVSEFGYCNAMPVNFCGVVNDCEEDGKPKWCPLKAQEPWVMTLEEVKAKPDYAWIEKLDSKKTYIVLFDFTAVLNDLSSYAHTWNHYGKDELLLLLLYNKTWRCWTSRPTDEQREAIPWMKN